MCLCFAPGLDLRFLTWDLETAYKHFLLRPWLWAFHGLIWEGVEYFWAALPFGDMFAAPRFELILGAIYRFLRMRHVPFFRYIDDGASASRAALASRQARLVAVTLARAGLGIN